MVKTLEKTKNTNFATLHFLTYEDKSKPQHWE